MARKTRKAPRGGRYLLQSYWSGAPLSLLERACLTSWVAFGARVHLYTHDSISGLEAQIPAVVRRHIRVLDADAIVDRSRKFNYKGDAPKSKRADAFTALPFSDLFRYEMLRKVGGIWMDMDIMLVRPMPARVLAAPYFFVTERTMQKGAYASKDPTKATNACIGAREPNSPWARWITETAAATEATSAWTYMKVFQDSLDALSLRSYLEPPEFVMPVNWWDLDGLFEPADKLAAGGCLKSKYGVPSTCPADIFKNPRVIGVHFFRGLLRKRDLPYEDAAKVPPMSLYGRLLAHVDAAAAAL
jgi:hypothetical protein